MHILQRSKATIKNEGYGNIIPVTKGILAESLCLKDLKAIAFCPL